MMRRSSSPPRSCSPCSPPAAAQEDTVHEAETEGIYLDVDDLDYQVQISRYMNPGRRRGPRVPVGLPSRRPSPGRRDVVRRVHAGPEHDGRDDHAGNDFQIVDTQENGLPADPDRHERQPVRLQAGPDPAQGPDPGAGLRGQRDTIQGSLLLFKVKTESLQNRPLEFRFKRGSGHRGRRRPRRLAPRASASSAASMTVFAAGAAVAPPAP